MKIIFFLSIILCLLNVNKASAKELVVKHYQKQERYLYGAQLLELALKKTGKPTGFNHQKYFFAPPLRVTYRNLFKQRKYHNHMQHILITKLDYKRNKSISFFFLKILKMVRFSKLLVTHSLMRTYVWGSCSKKLS